MSSPLYDLAIIGGGINGAGLARDASGRGLKVVLVEAGDLGGATSSASSKLVHGGLRYLEHGEFRLVREALLEREVLLGIAPHIIRPLRFILPQVPGMRPAALVRLGLGLYDHLAKRNRIPASAALDLASDPAGRPLAPQLARGFAYYDCWVDDARLVVLNAMDAAARGADIRVRTKAEAVRCADGLWQVDVVDDAGQHTIASRALVNAAGPWAAEVARVALGNDADAKAPRVRLVKGSHIVVPRIAGAEDAYLMQSADGRVVFTLPFEDRFTLIGTTDVPYAGDPRAVAISSEEEFYLLDIVSRFFAVPVPASSIVWRFAGVRPLLDDGKANPSAVSRDYHFDLVVGEGRPALLNIIGGKITTYRRLAEEALAQLAPHVSMAAQSWTGSSPLPGGDGDIAAYRLDLARRRPNFDLSLLWRLARLYGTRADAVLGDAKNTDDLGGDLGAGLTKREVLYLKENEWARTADDVLWRRTKVGVGLAADQRRRLADGIDALLG